MKELNTPFYFENVDISAIEISVKKNDEVANTATLEVSTDNINWELWGITSTTPLTKTIGIFERLYIRNAKDVGHINNYTEWSYNYFSSTGAVNVGGNLMSLGYKNFKNKYTIEQPYAYCYLFKDMDKLVYASNIVLPATSLAEGCYYGMFTDCESLRTAPKLPATELSIDCYSSMFEGCESLVIAPELPATQLADYCYSCMFDCCMSLGVAPKLPATQLAEGCYDCIFRDCKSLTYVKAMFINTDNDALEDWLDGVAPTGTFVKNTDATWSNDGIVPSGWEVATAIE